MTVQQHFSQYELSKNCWGFLKKNPSITSGKKSLKSFRFLTSIPKNPNGGGLLPQTVHLSEVKMFSLVIRGELIDSEDHTTLEGLTNARPPFRPGGGFVFFISQGVYLQKRNI